MVVSKWAIKLRESYQGIGKPHFYFDSIEFFKFYRFLTNSSLWHRQKTHATISVSTVCIRALHNFYSHDLQQIYFSNKTLTIGAIEQSFNKFWRFYQWPIDGYQKFRIVRPEKDLKKKKCHAINFSIFFLFVQIFFFICSTIFFWNIY